MKISKKKISWENGRVEFDLKTIHVQLANNRHEFQMMSVVQKHWTLNILHTLLFKCLFLLCSHFFFPSMGIYSEISVPLSQLTIQGTARTHDRMNERMNENHLTIFIENPESSVHKNEDARASEREWKKKQFTWNYKKKEDSIGK